MTQETKEDLVKRLEPKARQLSDATAGACQSLIEALAAQQEFVAEHKHKFGLFEYPTGWRIPIELQNLITRRGMESESNPLQRALTTFDRQWGGLRCPPPPPGAR